MSAIKSSTGPQPIIPEPWKAAFQQSFRKWIEQGLDEDGSPWDWTTLGTMVQPRSAATNARVIAKSDGVWAGEALVQALNRVYRDRFSSVTLQTPGRVFATSNFGDGARVKKGDVLCEWSGAAPAILALERPFLNLAAFASGIATQARALVDAVQAACPECPPRVTSTRKTLPGYRDLSVYGVICGGGISHRINLAGGVLIKENHVASAGSIRSALDGARAVAPHSLRLEIEVRDESELQQAIDAGADAVLLDNFSPDQVRAALSRIAGCGRQIVTEISGGLNESNIASYAIPGVDVLSVGSITHSVKALDFSLLVEGT